METKTYSDHREDILAYRNDLEAELTAALAGEFGEDYEDPGEWINARFLSIETWRNEASGEIRVEWLLTCGGPTVTLIWDSRWTTGELRHSWGFDPRTGEDRNTAEVKGELLEQLAETCGIEVGLYSRVPR